MEFKSQKQGLSKRRASQFATRQVLRSTSFYKSINSTSTILPIHTTHQKALLLQSQNNYLTTRAQSSKYNSTNSLDLGLSSTCWSLYDENSNTQLGFRNIRQREIASLTKIMTTVVGLQLKNKYNISPNTLIRVTEGSTKNIGTTAGLKVDHWIFLKDIFYGIMLPSGNDAAHLLSEFMGSVLVNSKRDESYNPEKIHLIDLTRESTVVYIAEFVKYMNHMAERLGLALTRFSNPHGLQNAMNISTAKDILSLSVYASKNTRFRAIMNAESHRYHQYSGDETRTTKQVKIWENTNVLLREGWEGVKTGQTQAAGCCLSSLKDGIYIVVLNCPDPLKRFTETKRLYEWYTSKGKDWRNATSAQSFQF